MNIIDIQDQLKNFSEQQLISEMQMPTGSAPQFLVLGEIKRRKRVRDDFMKREAANQPTVAEEAIAAAGVPQSGVRGMSEAMAPQAAVAEGGIGSVMPQSMRPQTMPAPTDDAIPMRSGGLAQFGQELSQKVSSDTVEPFLDEVESMASDRFGVDLGDGPMQRPPFMGRIPTYMPGLRNLFEARFGPLAQKLNCAVAAKVERSSVGRCHSQYSALFLRRCTQKAAWSRPPTVCPLACARTTPATYAPVLASTERPAKVAGMPEFGSEDEGLEGYR